MRNLKLIVLLFFSMLAGATVAQDAEYSSKLKTVLETNGSMKSYNLAIDIMLDSFKKMKSEVPAEFWEEVSAEMKQLSIDDLVEMLVPVYYKYLTAEELEEIIAFYQTPAGKKLGESTPDIMRESMEVGSKWGQAVGEKVAAMLKERGY